ncbi:MAG: metal ABC transporter ATP-binding protein [Candidatus Doudnabacteria bacterium]|nr:metal ABC transporter ATP-binding protein [Candidatus Doudnabacteria bacterium]
MDINEPVISLDNICVSLGGRTILHDINVSVNNGEFVAVLGPNGAGKSTLFKILLGLLKPDCGDVRVLGNVPRRGNSQIGYAPQHRVLETDVALRARDVVGFGLDGNKWGVGWPSQRRTEIINQALKEVDALHLADSSMGQLSGGEQQRLLIAQAMITNPKILLLDEPLSNLDIQHSQDIVALAVKLTREKHITILLVTHDVNPLLPFIDRVLFLARGHGAMGKPDEVITNESLSKLYGTSVEVVKSGNRVFIVGAET